MSIIIHICDLAHDRAEVGLLDEVKHDDLGCRVQQKNESAGDAHI